MINERAIKQAFFLKTTLALVFDIFLLALAIYSGWWMGERHGRDETWKTAYDTRNVSDGLEKACTVLWVGEQNKKYWEKEQKSGR